MRRAVPTSAPRDRTLEGQAQLAPHTLAPVPPMPGFMQGAVPGAGQATQKLMEAY